MKKLKEFIVLLWRLPETLQKLEEDKIRLLKIEDQQREITNYLGDISAFASYVKDKDEKSDDTLKLLSSIKQEAENKSKQELEDDLVALEDILLATQASQAVGRYEIEQKNKVITELEVQRSKLRTQLQTA